MQTETTPAPGMGRTDPLEIAAQRGALVIERKPGAKKMREAWRRRCNRDRRPFLAVTVRRHEADVVTDPIIGEMNAEAQHEVVALLCKVGAYGGVGAYTSCDVPVEAVADLVEKLVEIFTRPGAIVPWRTA